MSPRPLKQNAILDPLRLQPVGTFLTGIGFVAISSLLVAGNHSLKLSAVMLVGRRQFSMTNQFALLNSMNGGMVGDFFVPLKTDEAAKANSVGEGFFGGGVAETIPGLEEKNLEQADCGEGGSAWAALTVEAFDGGAEGFPVDGAVDFFEGTVVVVGMIDEGFAEGGLGVFATDHGLVLRL